MNLLDYKINYILSKTRYQIVLAEENGRVLESCNTIIDFSEYHTANLFVLFPFFESLREYLKQLPRESEELIYPRVELTLPGGSAKVFDFSFRKTSIDGQCRLLVIFKNITEDYTYLSEIQTERRTALIQKEFLEIQNQKIELEKQLLHLENTELERNRKFKNEFFSKVSHELRTPLNGIMGLTTLLKNISSEEQREYLDALQYSSRHLVSLINDILDLSKLESDNMTFEQTEFDLRELLVSMQATFKYQLEEKKLGFSLLLDEEIPSLLVGDSARLSQIFYNLLGNAVKFTEQGKIVVEAEVNAFQSDETTCWMDFYVRDTGIGIPEDRLPKLFLPYSQGKDETYRLYGGTGLGLAVVKQLVDLQGGEISVKSKVNKGTIFHISLPFKTAAEKTNQVLPGHIDKESVTVIFENKNVLVADDNEVNLFIMNRLLKEWKFKIETAENGKVAVGKIAAGNFDIVLMDLQMPEMDGTEAILYVRNELQISREKLPIIALTASMPSEELSRLLEDYANGYVLKPFNVTVLQEKMAILLQKQRAGKA